MADTSKGRFFVNAEGFSYFSVTGKPAGGQGGDDSSTESGGLNIQEIYTGEQCRNDAVPRKPVAAMTYGQRVRIARLHAGYEEFIDKKIRVGGWAKSVRAQKEMVFIELNDGSCFSSLQVIINKSAPGFEDCHKSIVGSSYMFEGLLIKSPAKGQAFELSLTDPSDHKATVTGKCDGTYPIQGRPNIDTLR